MRVPTSGSLNRPPPCRQSPPHSSSEALSSNYKVAAPSWRFLPYRAVSGNQYIQGEMQREDTGGHGTQHTALLSGASCLEGLYKLEKSRFISTR